MLSLPGIEPLTEVWSILLLEQPIKFTFQILPSWSWVLTLQATMQQQS